MILRPSGVLASVSVLFASWRLALNFDPGRLESAGAWLSFAYALILGCITAMLVKNVNFL